MTTDSGPRAKLDRLAKAMVEDLFETPDEEVLAELDAEAVMRTAEADLEAVRIRMGKERLATAKAGVAADLPAPRPRRRLDPKDARRRLSSAVSRAGGPDKRKWFARSPDVPEKWWPNEQLDAQSYAFDILFGRMPDDLHPHKIGADAWFDRWEADRFEVREQ